MVARSFFFYPLPFTLYPLLFTFYFPIPLKYPDYHLEMRQWRQMRQMRHFFCTLVFSDLDGQKRVPLPKSGKSVAFCTLEGLGELLIDDCPLMIGREAGVRWCVIWGRMESTDYADFGD